VFALFKAAAECAVQMFDPDGKWFTTTSRNVISVLSSSCLLICIFHAHFPTANFVCLFCFFCKIPRKTD
jgi:hypothetical protein